MKRHSLPDTEKKIQSRGGRVWWKSAFLWIPLIAVLDTLVIEMFNHKVFSSGFASLFQFIRVHPLALLVNFLLVLVTLTPAFFLRRRTFWCTLVSAIWLMGGGANGFILMNRMTPFTTADLTVVNTGLDTLPNYLSTGYIILLVVVLILLVFGLLFLLIKGPKNDLPLRRRLLIGVVTVALSGAALSGCWAWAQGARQLSTVFPNLAFAYEDYGFPYCFLETWLNKGIQEPNGYSEREMSRVLKEIDKDSAGATTATAQTDVNVIYIQLESFIDPLEFEDLALSEDPVPVWHQLEENFTSGYLGVPVVGAGTANTEFEMLTGMSSRLFGPGEYPYKTCLQDKTVESIAYDLGSLGYATHAIHNHRATFYSRNVVYANLGFDDFTPLEYMPQVSRTPKGWAKDSILTSQITKALDSTEDRSDLVFTVSVQGHGSYPTVELLENPAITVTACPKDCNELSMEYYVNQIHEMDTFVGNLINKLSDRGEKTMLILYGDHLPSLNLTKGDMKSGSLYKTRYVIWDNFGLAQEDQDLYAYQLSASALLKIGISQGKILKFQQYCQKEPSYRTDLKEIQYDILYGQNYFYDGKTPYQPTNMQMGVGTIAIDKLYQRNGLWYVEGESFSPYCVVTAKGKALDTTYITPTLLRIDQDPGTEAISDLGISVIDMHNEVLSDTE